MLDDDLPALVGWVGVLCVVPVVTDVTCSKLGLPTMSNLAGRYVWKPWAGPVVAAISAGLGWHLVQSAIKEKPE